MLYMNACQYGLFALQSLIFAHVSPIRLVQDFALYIIFAVAPLVLEPIINFLTVRSWWDFHCSWLGCKAYQMSAARVLT